ncbi:MAG: hypothetical protein IV104_09980, partial [Acidovorax sp.]|nr:hypothetical protein [Acidovorax sp.]
MAKSIPIPLTITPTMLRTIKESLDESVEKLPEKYGSENSEKLEKFIKSLGQSIIPDEAGIYPLLTKMNEHEKNYHLGKLFTNRFWLCRSDVRT